MTYTVYYTVPLNKHISFNIKNVLNPKSKIKRAKNQFPFTFLKIKMSYREHFRSQWHKPVTESKNFANYSRALTQKYLTSPEKVKLLIL